MASPRLLQKQRLSMEALGEKLGFKEMKDWYKLTVEIIRKHGGSGLLSKYRNSPPLLVQSVFPDHTWETHQFGTVPKGHWNNVENAREFMNWLGKVLGFNEMKD